VFVLLSICWGGQQELLVFSSRMPAIYLRSSTSCSNLFEGYLWSPHFRPSLNRILADYHNNIRICSFWIWRTFQSGWTLAFSCLNGINLFLLTGWFTANQPNFLCCHCPFCQVSTHLKTDWIITGHHKNSDTIGKQNYQEPGVEAELN